MMISRTSRAFTLIELLVVIAIIGFLSAIVLASLNVARNKGYDASRESSLREVQKAVEAYYADNGKYPSANGNYNTGSLGAGNGAIDGQCQAVGATAQNSVITGLVPNYIASLPSDPQMVASSNTCCYEYMVSSDGSQYKYAFYGCSASAAGSGTNGLNDPPGTYHHNGMWSVYSGSGTYF